MQISIDGAERLLLLALLKEHIQKQESNGKKPLQNCWDKDAGQSLIDRLSPTDWSDEIDVADYLLSKDDGKLYEVVHYTCKENLVVVEVGHPANLDSNDFVHTSIPEKTLVPPPVIPLEDIPKRSEEAAMAA